MNQSCIVAINNISVSYDDHLVLSNVDLQIESGQIYGIVGPNGAGKSTLFKAILGLLEIDNGSISVFGENIKQVRKRLVYIPQRSDIDWGFPATVLDVVVMGRYPHKKLLQRINKKDKEIALDALDKVGMLSFQNRQIGQLSGGQQQRVFIARALCQDADLLLLDEPFVGVDAVTEENIMEILSDLAKEGKSTLMIHHDLASVLKYFTKTILINKKIIASGPTREVFTQENVAITYGATVKQ
ncbi:MAG: metal ABC transporter ATP-binding protein [Bacteroidota bacterium]